MLRLFPQQQFIIGIPIRKVSSLNFDIYILMFYVYISKKMNTQCPPPKFVNGVIYPHLKTVYPEL